jgi:hypothetical protein
MLGRALAFVIYLGLGVNLSAHDPGLSTAHASVRPELIVVDVTFAPPDLRTLKPPAAAPAEWIRGLFELRVAAAVLTPQSTTTKITPEKEIQFELTYLRPTNGGEGELRALRLNDLPPGHRQFVTVEVDRGPALAQRLLTAREPTVKFDLRPVASDVETKVEEPTTAVAFVKLGIEHIWTGYDHLLFLLGLLIVCARFKSIVAIISCFTLAHSLTLALATLKVLSVSSRFVEPMIAASIVFVGLENLVRRGAEPKGRWALTFLFGLIHGFGFASVLRELGVGQGGGGLLMPLFTFNLGVEIGQVAIAAATLPIIWRLRSNDAFVRRGVPALSALVVAAGLYWFLERTLFA